MPGGDTVKKSAFIGVHRRLNKEVPAGAKSSLYYLPPMNADERRFPCPDSLTERVMGAILEVSNVLGAGFLEKVYERALLKELRLGGIEATSQGSIAIHYKGRCVGECYADILVENALVVDQEHTAHCLNYRRASGFSVCLLVNFQKPRAEWRRIVYRYRADDAEDDLLRQADRSDTQVPTRPAGNLS